MEKEREGWAKVVNYDLKGLFSTSAQSLNMLNLDKIDTHTHLKDSCQDCQGTCYLYSVCVPSINVHTFCSISAIYNKVTVWCQPLRHTPNHDADHSKRTWTYKTRACRRTIMHKDTSKGCVNVLSVLYFLITATFMPISSPTYGDVSGSTKDEVNQHWVEGGVKAKHWA